MQRFQPSRPNKLVTSLADAVKFLVDADPTAVKKTENLAIPATSLTPL
jgi:hypothetical protein